MFRGDAATAVRCEHHPDVNASSVAPGKCLSDYVSTLAQRPTGTQRAHTCTLKAYTCEATFLAFAKLCDRAACAIHTHTEAKPLDHPPPTFHPYISISRSVCVCPTKPTGVLFGVNDERSVKLLSTHTPHILAHHHHPQSPSPPHTETYTHTLNGVRMTHSPISLRPRICRTLAAFAYWGGRLLVHDRAARRTQDGASQDAAHTARCWIHGVPHMCAISSSAKDDIPHRWGKNADLGRALDTRATQTHTRH